jgi:hypothetical protein
MAGQYDTTITSTIPAGNYYIGADNQADDLLYQLQLQATTDLRAAIVAAGPPGHTSGSEWVCATLIRATEAGSADQVVKVRIGFQGAAFVDNAGWENDVKIQWTDAVAVNLANALGYDTSGDDASTSTDYPIFTADRQHTHGWYAKRDGEFRSIMRVDTPKALVLSGRAIGGQTARQYYGEHYDNELSLQFIPSIHMFSNGQDYADAPLEPWGINLGLECWWRAVRDGTPFRVYRDGYRLPARAGDTGTASAATVTTLTDASKVWWSNSFFYPWADRLLYRPEWGDDGTTKLSQGFYITSHTSTVLTVPLAHPNGENLDAGTDTTYYLFDHTYGTYVLDPAMDTFEPKEIPATDEYNLTIPLMKYVP